MGCAADGGRRAADVAGGGCTNVGRLPLAHRDRRACGLQPQFLGVRAVSIAGAHHEEQRPCQQRARPRTPRRQARRGRGKRLGHGARKRQHPYQRVPTREPTPACPAWPPCGDHMYIHLRRSGDTGVGHGARRPNTRASPQFSTLRTPRWQCAPHAAVSRMPGNTARPAVLTVSGLALAARALQSSAA
jgi:hypothetical protein